MSVPIARSVALTLALGACGAGACGAPSASQAPPATQNAASSASSRVAPAASAASTPPPPPPGERPSVGCRAPHPVAELPLSSIDVDSWAKSVFDYRPQANAGRPVGWEGAESAVEAYLEGVHACLHVAFADSFLRSLAGLPKTHPLSDPELTTTVELVVDGESGELAEVGVVASSGVAELDAAAVAAFGRAFPLEPPPSASLSSDGRLYVTWELHRRVEEACTRAQARPWKLRF